MRRIERSAGQSTISATQTEVSLSSEISSEGRLDPARPAGPVLRRNRGAGRHRRRDAGQGAATPAGPAGACVVRDPVHLDSASAGLRLGLGGEAGGSTPLTVGGRLSGRAARLWTKAQTRSFNLTNISGTTDTLSTGATTGGRSARGGEERRGAARSAAGPATARAGAPRAAGRAAQASPSAANITAAATSPPAAMCAGIKAAPGGRRKPSRSRFGATCWRRWLSAAACRSASGAIHGTRARPTRPRRCPPPARPLRLNARGGGRGDAVFATCHCERAASS
jgi:hypothetical protein